MQIRFVNWIRRVLAVGLVVLGHAASSEGQIYSPPASDREDISLDSGWRFIQQDVSGAQNPSFNDSSWTNVNVPHVWDIPDGQSYPPANFYQGPSWYRSHFTPSINYTNSHFFLKFDGASLVTDVYLNGIYLGEHDGGFAAFVFDITPYVNVGSDNVLAVRVNNAVNTNIPPLAADFTFWGGIYRDVHLLVTAPVQISPLDYGSPGVYLSPTNVSASSANLQVTTVVSNSTATSQTVTVRAVVIDASTNIVTTMTNMVTIPPSTVSNIVTAAVIANPHLWNGLTDPYVYQTFVELWNATGVVDVVAQPLGFRWYSVDPTNGFFLNGRHYDLHGVNMHQDRLNSGWALTNAQRDTNFVFLKEIGATFLRLSHYEHNDYTYQLADQNGICVWSEMPLIDYITQSSAFYTNTLQQLREMIRQRYNHPSIMFWSIYNEVTLDAGPSPTNLISLEAQLVAQEDPTRLSTAAANTSDNDPSTFYTQVIAFNKYYGWYSSPLNGIAAWADNIHATYPTRCVGVSEYGAGASIYQHNENPTFPANTAASFHPEEWQDIVHETNWELMAARPFLWCKMVWTSFDFASDGRDEGDTPGRNDKGLVTYDRQTRKDTFYFYKANWTTNPMVYITGHTFTNRFTNMITAKVYANCDSVTLYLNGASHGPVTSTNCIYTWPITLQSGTNFVTAIGIKGTTTVTDSLDWIPPTSPPVVTILSPAGAVASIFSTNDSLLLSAAVSNPVPAFPLTTMWSQASGPGVVSFANSNSLATSAVFSSNGLYGLDFTASNGGSTTVPVTVIVGGGDGPITNGLLGWWKMNDGSGSIAADSSGNGRSATVSGAYFTNFNSGYPSNALHFNGSNSYASFASPGVTQLTLVAWARASGDGNSPYPRIFDTPGYRLFFRFDNQGDNGFDFATYSTGNGDWFSGQNSIGLGGWYRVAASYDLSNLTYVPEEYVNGAPISSPTVITTPSGTQPSSAGTGYIGNGAALTRGWSGDLSDLRIYNRILSQAEVAALAETSSVNYAPSAGAGTNQTVIWPGTVTLSGTVNDNGNSPGSVTTTWTQTAGPPGVAFGNSNSVWTTASFPAPGTYQLQLAVGNGQATTVSSLTVNAITPELSLLPLPGALQLSWPANTSNWLLEYQSNPPSAGLGTNWLYWAGPATNPFTTPVYPGAGSTFYRLILNNP